MNKNQSPSVSAEAILDEHIGVPGAHKREEYSWILAAMQEYKQTSDLAGNTVYVLASPQEQSAVGNSYEVAVAHGWIPSHEGWLKPITIGETDEAVEILKELCHLKHYKDHVGKDLFYEKNQPLAWKKANELLNRLSKNSPISETGREEEFRGYCKEWNNVGYVCEEQCNACKKAENMPELRVQGEHTRREDGV